jgi:putative FmdB family regulatory protein
MGHSATEDPPSPSGGAGCILAADNEACLVREETAMPTYSYRCEACGATFERVETITEHRTDKPRCPKCDGEKVVQVPTPFVAMTGKKS